MSLKLLDESVKSYIRTGVAISCISQSVEELVLNSLDAGAQCITVRIHIPNLFVQVTDNGTGISYDDLQCIGERYTTSKCHTSKDLDDLRFHGYRGEALASIKSCCGVVELTSRHCLSSSTYCKIFHNGNNLGICPVKRAGLCVGIGTMVTLRDIFYNMPVRRKIICSSTESDKIRRMLIAIALIHPDVSFTLQNDETSDKLLHTRKTNSILRNFEQLFGIPLTLSLQEVSAKNDPFKISGYVSTKGYYTKSYQFIYLNKRHIKHTRLHTHMNSLLSNSLITRKLSKSTSLLEHQYRSVPVESHGVYVLNIECSVTEYDICLEPAKTLVEFKQWNILLEAVKQAVSEFLVKNDLTLGVSSLVEEEAHTSDTTCNHSPLSSRTGSTHNIVNPEPIHRNEDRVLTDPEPTLDEVSAHRSVDPAPIHRNVVPAHGSVDPVPILRNVVPAHGSVAVPIHRNVDKVPASASVNPVPTHNSVVYGIQSRPAYRPCPSQSTRTSSQTTSISSDYTTQGPSTAQLNNVHHSRMTSGELLPPTSKRKKTANEGDTLLESSTTTTTSNRVKMIGLTGPMRSPLGGRATSIAKKLSGRLNTVWQRQHPAPSTTSSMDTLRQPQQQSEEQNDKLSIKITADNAAHKSVQRNDSVSNSIQALSHDCHVTDESDTDIPISHTGGEGIDDCNNPINGHTMSFADNQTTTVNSQPINLSGVDSQQSMSIINSPINLKTTYNSMTSQSVLVTNNPQIPHVTNHSYTLPNSPTTTTGHAANDPLNRCTVMDSQCAISVTNNPIMTSQVDPVTLQVDPVTSQVTSVTDNVTSQVSNVTNNTVDSHEHFPLRAAPHLSYGYSSLMPRPKESRKTIFNGIDSSLSLGVDLPESKWRDRHQQEVGGVNLSNILSDWTNPSFPCGGNDIIDVGLPSEKLSSIRIHSIIHPYKFTNAIFDNIEVLGQIDRKFIACLLKTKAVDSKIHRLLVFFDQHAVHERVRVEALIKDSYTSDGTISSVKVDPPQVISLTDSDQRLSVTYSKQLKAIGVSLSKNGNGQVLVNSMPSTFCERDLSERRRGRSTIAMALVQELVTKQLDLLCSTCGVCSVVPTVILQVLNSQACHGAIKFGDPLTNAECSELIHSLSKCNLPFQCAHGRPSLIPILDLDMLEKRYPMKQQGHDGRDTGRAIDIGKLKKLHTAGSNFS